MVAASRPEWTRTSTGLPIDCVVKVHGGNQGARQDVLTSRNRVSLVRPGSLQPKPEDEYELSFVYGSEATNADVHDRTIMPLLKKLVEGYNVSIIVFGATGSGKTTILEGNKGKDVRNHSEGNGLAHLAADELFELLHSKAIAVGEAIAKRRRMPSSKGYDFFVESSFVEIYNESCHDLYSSGADGAANLPVMEDVNEGYQVTGLSTRAAKTAADLRTCFNLGRSNRDTQMMDLGSVHERTAAVFTVYLAQYTPGAVHGEEDRIMVSRLQLVDMPGAERLAMDPEVLRLREGVQLNKSLLSFAVTVRTLAQEGSTEFCNYEESTLTELVADALGGNCLTVMIGTIRQGDWEQSATTLKQLTMARNVRNLPIVNHSRARGLLHKLRFRLQTVVEDRETLREQMSTAPADGDPEDIAINVAKIRDMEARLLEEREEKASLMAEKQALQARLAKLKDAGADELHEKAELQEALIRSEEQRLEVSRALIDFQMEFNEAKQTFENEKYELEQRLMELEARKLEHYVRVEDHAGLQDACDRLNSELKLARDEVDRARKGLEAAQQQTTEAQAEVKRLTQLMNALEAASQGDARALLQADDAADVPAPGTPTGGGSGAVGGFGGAGYKSKVNLTELRHAMQQQLKVKDRKLNETLQAMEEMQAEMDKIRATRTITQEQLDHAREIFQRKLEGHMREMSDLVRIAAMMQTDSDTPLRTTPDALFGKMNKLVDEFIQASEDKQSEMRRDLDDLQVRHAELRRRFQRLIAGYRHLRYRFQDEWPVGSDPPKVATEDAVVAGKLEDIVRAEEDSDGRIIRRLRDKLSKMEHDMSGLKVAQLQYDTGLTPSLAALRVGPSAGSGGGSGPDVTLQLENSRLREELDGLKRRVRASETGQLPDSMRAGSPSQPQLRAEVDRLRAENERMRNGSSNQGGPDAARTAIKEFTLNTQYELERKLASCESRAVMAEEQLAALQKYIAQASIMYQREIVRLRALVGSHGSGAAEGVT